MKKILIFISILLVLNGCASFYDKQVANPESYHTPTKIDDNYNISGRFSIKTDEKNYYGNFNWQHESGNDALDFMSPIGTTVAQIRVESGTAELTTEDKTYSGKNLDEMLQDKLGFVLPINYLHYWIQGVPLPNYPVQNRLTSGFTQLNWKVEYLTWQDTDHPQVVQVSREDLRIKLLINW